MAIPKSLQEFAAAAGYRETSLERMLRAQRPTQHQRSVGRGPSRVDLEPEPIHLANLLLGTAAPEPSHSPETIEAYAPCQYLCSPGGNSADQTPRWGPGTLREILVEMIEASALNTEVLQLKADQWSHADNRQLPSYLNFGSQPLNVEVIWMTSSGRREKVDVYAPPFATKASSASYDPWYNSNVKHYTVVPGSLIYAAGKIWAVTLQRRGVTLLPKSGQTPASAAPNSENVASPAREAASRD